MAFGDKARAFLEAMEKEQATKASGSTGSGGKAFVSLECVVKNTGLKKVRLLPDESMSTDKHGYFTLSDYVPFGEIWIPVYDAKKGTTRQQRVFIDPVDRYNNPYWERQQSLDKKSRRAVRLMFAWNVVNLSDAIVAEDGTIVYPDQHGNFTHKGQKLDKELAQPLNRVMTLVGSYGKPNGDHLFSKIQSVIENQMIESDDGEEILADPLSYDIVIKSTLAAGADPKETQRTVTARPQRKLKDQDKYWSAARPDLSYYDGWPLDAVELLLSDPKQDINEVYEKYGIKRFLSLSSTGETAKSDGGELDEDEVF